MESLKLNKNQLFIMLWVCYLLHACFLIGLFFDTEVGAEIFLRNVRWLSTEYTALYPRRQNSSYQVDLVCLCKIQYFFIVDNVALTIHDKAHRSTVSAYVDIMKPEAKKLHWRRRSLTLRPIFLAASDHKIWYSFLCHWKSWISPAL
jgi:hypothetical protein